MSASEHHEPPETEGQGTRLRRLFKNTGIYALGDIGLKLLSALFAPILTYYLVPAEMGIWSLCIMLFSGLSTIYGLALFGAVTRFYFDHEFDDPVRRRFQGSILSFLFLWTAGLSVILTLVGPWIFDATFDELPFWPYGAFVVWMAFLNVLHIVPKATWAAAEQSKAFVAVSVMGSVSNLVGSLGLVIFASMGVLGLFYGKTVSLLILAIPFGLYSIRRVGLAWHTGDLKKALLFSLPLLPHLLAHWVLGMSDRFIIENHYRNAAPPDVDAQMMGLRAVGIYSAAYIFIEFVNMISVAMNRAFVPQFTRAYGDEEQRPFIARSITYFLLAVSAGSVALVVLSSTLIRGLFEAKYHEAAAIAPILAIGGLFQGVYYVYVNGLFYYKKNGLVPIITIVSGAINVALNLIWLPLFGLEGAAWATVIGYAVLALGMRWGCRRLTRLPFETGRLTRLALVIIPVGGISMFIDAQFPLLTEVGIKLGLLFGGLLALYVMRFWTEDELAWFRGKLPWRKAA